MTPAADVELLLEDRRVQGFTDAVDDAGARRRIAEAVARSERDARAHAA